MLSILARTPAMTPGHHNFYHGRLKHYPPQSDPRVGPVSRQSDYFLPPRSPRRALSLPVVV